MHPDYPLLLSSFIAQLWKFSGGATSPLVPILTAFAFAASVLALLVSAVAVARGTGLALLAGLGCYWLVSRRRRGGVGRTMAPWWYSLIGAVPGLLIVCYFKAFLAPPNDLAGQTPIQALHKMVEADRYIRIGKSLVTEALRLGDWSTNPLVLLAILAIALRLRIVASQTRPILAIGLTLASLFAAYCAVYLVTPLDLGWHLNTSLQRLYAQIWPSSLFLMFLALKTPEECLDASSKD